MAHRAQQFLLALVFLTRLPFGGLLPARILSLADSTWAFPLVGAVVGALAGLPLLLPVPPILAAVLSVVVAVLLTGALHEDALADFADAAGGKDRDDRLRIMRNSRIGSFGMMALLLVTALRIAALTVLGPAVLIAASASGRTAAVLAMGALVPARSDGLGRGAGEPGWRNILAASFLALVFLALAGPGWGWALLAGLVVLAVVIRQARLWLGGQTGDVLGTASILTETAILIAFTATAASAGSLP